MTGWIALLFGLAVALCLSGLIVIFRPTRSLRPSDAYKDHFDAPHLSRPMWPTRMSPHARQIARSARERRERIEQRKLQLALERSEAPVRDRIHLTTRQLESLNIRRRLAGKLPLSKFGFMIAVRTAPPEFSCCADAARWITYLTAYEARTTEETTPRVSCDYSMWVS